MEELDLKKKLVAIALAGTILATSIVTPFTAQADEILTKIQQQETKISELDSKQSTATENLSAITAEVDAAEKRADTLLANRVKTQDEIVALQEDIAELQVVIAQREEQLDEQARSVQVNGSNENYLNFIVASESFTDLVSRIDVVSKMVSANKELVEQQIADQKAVEDKKSKTEENLSKINAMAMELEQLKGDLQVKKIEQESAIAALAAEKATAESDRQMFLAQKEEADQRAAAEAAAIAAAEAAAATVAATVAQASSEESSTAASSVDIASSTVASSESAAPAQTVAAAPVVESAPVVSAPAAPVVSAPVVSAPVVTAPTLSAPTGDVVSIAAKYIGVPYVWGGKTPSGFDCSGFTSYVFREAYGIEIGGYTVPQENSGTQIAVSSAQAGDLIFWGSRGATYHVAIYVGGGQYIHAPAPGQTVTYSSYNLSGASFAVRVAR